MLPTAISQIIEAVGKLLFGLLFAHWALNKGYDTPIVAAFAGLGLTIGTLFSVFYLLIEKVRFRSLDQSSKSQPSVKYVSLWKSLSRLAIPMTIGASLVSVTKLIDMTMILRRLQAIGYTEALANEAYGSYTTLALSIFGLLPTLLNSIALPLVPLLSGAIAEGDRPKQVQMIRTSYRLTAIFSIPAALAISAFAKPVLLLLFGHDAKAVAIAAPLLSYLGVSVFLSCMITATNSVLHSYQIVNRPILSMLIGAGVKIISAYFLIGNPQIGLMGAPISTFLCNLAVVLLNLYFSSKLCDLPDMLSFFMRPLLASSLAVGIGLVLYRSVGSVVEDNSLLTFFLIGFVMILYVFFACLNGTVREEDVIALPAGEKICKILKGMHLLRPDVKDNI